MRNFASGWERSWIVVKLLGYLLAWGLFGALSIQACEYQIPRIRLDFDKPFADIYHLAFAKDPLWTRAAIYLLYIFQTVQICLLSQTAFITFGLGFNNVESVDNIQHIWFSVPIMSSIGKSQKFTAHNGLYVWRRGLIWASPTQWRSASKCFMHSGSALWARIYGYRLWSHW